MGEEEERTLQKYVALNVNKDGKVEEFENIKRENIFKYLSDIMESGQRAYQSVNRKLSSFEDLFFKMHSLETLTELKMSLK